MKNYQARQLVEAARRDAPPAALEGAILGALGLGAVAATGPSPAAKVWASLKHAAVWKVSVGVLAMAATSGLYGAHRSHERGLRTRDESAALTASAPRTPNTVPGLPAPTATTQTAVATTVARASIPMSRATTTATGARRNTRTTARTGALTAPSSSSLTDEIASLQRAGASLAAGDAKTALDELDVYDGLNPRGDLREEALAIRVRAARLAGNSAEAERALKALATQFPNGPQLRAFAERR
jgi:hypothetical protein